MQVMTLVYQDLAPMQELLFYSFNFILQILYIWP